MGHTRHDDGADRATTPARAHATHTPRTRHSYAWLSCKRNHHASWPRTTHTLQASSRSHTAISKSTTAWRMPRRSGRGPGAKRARRARGQRRASLWRRVRVGLLAAVARGRGASAMRVRLRLLLRLPVPRPSPPPPPPPRQLLRGVTVVVAAAAVLDTSRTRLRIADQLERPRRRIARL